VAIISPFPLIKLIKIDSNMVLVLIPYFSTLLIIKDYREGAESQGRSTISEKL
jgi:hypothetical protein